MSDAPIVNMWVTEPPDAKVQQALDALRRAPDVAHVAVMPDVHPAAGAANGIAVATTRLIYPALVGGDIGCGFAAVAFDAAASPLRRRNAAQNLLDRLPEAAPVMRHRRRDDPPQLEGALAPESLTTDILRALAATEGRLELGTLGRGNHFLEFQADDADRLWIMVHSGSRAIGQHIHNHHTRSATAAGGGLKWLDADTDAGRAYLTDLAWARAYAATSRRHMLHSAADLLQELFGVSPDWSTLMNTDHNHVQQEDQAGQRMWVHRKGANCAAAGVLTMIPGSMATHTYHVEGRSSPEALTSSSHGAGRRLSRGAARAKISRKDLTRQLVDVWVDERVMSKLVDEAPTAYRDIDAVMRAQKDLVRMVRRLHPIVVYKGV